MPHNPITCIPTIFTSRKSTSRDRTRNLGHSMCVRYLTATKPTVTCDIKIIKKKPSLKSSSSVKEPKEIKETTEKNPSSAVKINYGLKHCRSISSIVGQWVSIFDVRPIKIKEEKISPPSPVCTSPAEMEPKDRSRDSFPGKRRRKAGETGMRRDTGAILFIW
ncbi:hypothetical protein TNCV_4696151 [Trichonephila clavipes]|nr:hypothetical protein TNCV_4696151 [Trichonephila clavipes]